MIRIKEDVIKVVEEYVQLENLIVDVCKKLQIIKTKNDYCGFQYNEEDDTIMVRVYCDDNEIEMTKDYTFDVGCLFSNYMIEETRSIFAKN